VKDFEAFAEEEGMRGSRAAMISLG